MRRMKSSGAAHPMTESAARLEETASRATLSVARSVADPLAGAVTSHVAALRLEEIDRSRIFFSVVLAMTIGGIAIALATHGDPCVRTLLIAASACSGLSATYVIFVALDPANYHPRRLILPGLPVVFGALVGVYYWGTVSPVTGLLVYGIYFFGLGNDARFITVNYALVAVSHGVLGLLIALDVVADRGVVRMTTLVPLDQASLLGMVEALYLVAFITARLSQKATLRAVAKFERAVRAVAHRDALLAEARAELQRVRDIGGAGRYSEQIVGAYRLGSVIGRGGIGEVYAAEHVATGSAAAVKLLRADALGDAIQVRRLLREAKAAARIACRHVVRVLDVGTTASGMPFVVMERMRGHDLAHELRSKRRLGLADTLTVIEDVAAGLEAARLVGIVHRDLKPHNVFGAVDESYERTWKILDFGVSKVGAAGTLTAGQLVGTPSYMAPEQARAEDVDHRADVYALAAILFRAVTGYAAFSGNDVATTIYEVVNKVPEQPSGLAELPRDVDRVLAIGLAKARDDRFATGLELARWFAAAIDGGLTADQRARADQQIARAPWGQAIRRVD